MLIHPQRWFKLIWNVEKPCNEKILTYAPETNEREKLRKKIEELKNTRKEIPLIIGGKPVKTSETVENVCPHDHHTVLGTAYLAGKEELRLAIDKALDAWTIWSEMEWYHRIAVFEKAAELLSGPYRYEAVASIMLNQSKTPYEAEIDLAELIDFWRFGAYYIKKIYEEQPFQNTGEFNRIDWRPLEGFILAIPPFNFYSIGGNLPTSPAMVGNVTLWKPSGSVIYSNYVTMKALLEAGLPKGVINFVPFSSKYTDIVLSHECFAGLHFTGSYETLVYLWKKINENLDKYKNFPRIVGETGGKDFLVIHPSADIDAAVTAIIRGAFEYQGQKCSALSRLFVAKSIWSQLKKKLLAETMHVKYSDPTDMKSFGGAMINKQAFDKAISYIEYAKQRPDEYNILIGGTYDSSKGWFIQPTIIETKNPLGKLMIEEIFAPILTVYIYEDAEYENMLESVDKATPYGLTGSIFAKKREAIVKAERKLRYAAGNFYINDKPTGSIVGRQPFGGARHSGTNDKAGYLVNFARWLNPRSIKETFVPPKEWRRPYME